MGGDVLVLVLVVESRSSRGVVVGTCVALTALGLLLLFLDVLGSAAVDFVIVDFVGLSPSEPGGQHTPPSCPH